MCVQAVIIERVAHCDATACDHRKQRRQRRLDQANDGFQHKDHERYTGINNVGIEQPGYKARQSACAQHTQRRTDNHSQPSQNQGHAEIDAGNLVSARADSLHHANLSHLLRQHGRQGIGYE